MFPQEIAEGQVVAGKYRIARVLGRGGMGLVVAAQHLELDEPVALKFLLPEALANREAVARFEREARAAVRIKSEHVVRVTDVGKLPSGAPYMVMEYLQGEDLSSLLERGALPLEQAVEFVLQACVAVADAHSLGIVHRDLKPGNLFCVRRSDGQLIIKVLDFGISKLTDATSGWSTQAESMSMTHTSAIMGSPLYMSPEQVQSSRDVDGRSDLWSLGVVLFELLTRNVPFLGQSFGDIAIKIATQAPPSVLTYRRDLAQGAELDAVLGKCLEKDRRQRYANVAEFALALLPFAPKEGRPLVRRITGILQAAGLSVSASAAPDSPHLPPTLLAGHAPAGTPFELRPPQGQQTDVPWSATRPPRPRTSVALWGGIFLAAASMVAGVVWFRASSSSSGTAPVTAVPALTAAAPAVTLAPPTVVAMPADASQLQLNESPPSEHAPPSPSAVLPVAPAARAGTKPAARAPARPAPTIAPAPAAPAAPARPRGPRAGSQDNAAGI